MATSSSANQLLCPEPIEEQRAPHDPVQYDDQRVFDNMLDVEHRYVPKIDYLCDFQEDIKPFMRNVVTIWMLEVCEDQQCEGQVYPMAINLLDRFLCVCVISRTQLQLAATACLLIASKTRQTRAFSTSLLSLYTNHSVSPEDIRDWELLIVSKLKWDLIGINGHDFASHIIARSPWTADHALLKNHAFTLIALGCTDSELIRTPPSVVGASSVASAVVGLKLATEEETIPWAARVARCSTHLIKITSAHLEKTLLREVAPESSPTTPMDADDLHF